MRQEIVIRIVMVCAIIGLGFSLYLHLIHSGLQNAPGCRINDYIDCEKVLAAKQYTAVLFGIPNQVVAICGFSLVFTLGMIRLRFPYIPHSDKIIFFIAGLNTFGACLGTYLQYISVTVIHNLCPFCVAAYSCDLTSLSFESAYFITLYREYRRKTRNKQT